MTKHVKSMETMHQTNSTTRKKMQKTKDEKSQHLGSMTFQTGDRAPQNHRQKRSATDATFCPTRTLTKGQSKQNRLNDQNKMLEMYRKRVVKSINLFVGQKAYVINRLEHMVKDDVDITGVIESTNIKDGQFRPTVGNTTENKLRRNDVYYMLDYYFQKEYRKLYPDDSENGSDTTTSEDDDDMSTGNKYQIIGGKHTLPIL